MCQFLKQFLSEIQSGTKAWSIRRQMLVCYMIGICTILFLVLFLVLFNFTLLQKEAISRVEDTLSTQSTENMSALTKQGSDYLASTLGLVNYMFNFIAGSIRGAEHAETYSLAETKIYTFQESLDNCKYTHKNTTYGPYGACFDYPIYYDLDGTADLSVLNRISPVTVFWDHIYYLTDIIVLRYFLLFKSSHFLIVYPGTYIEKPQLPTWYDEYIAQGTLYCSEAYKDELGDPENFIVTMAAPVRSNDGEIIATMTADILVSTLNNTLSGLSYLDKGEVFLVSKNGDILVNIRGNKEYQNITGIIGNHAWNNVRTKPEGLYFYIQDDQIYRFSSYPVAANISTEMNDPWFYLMSVVQENEVLRYRNQLQTNLESTRLYVSFGTAGSAIITTIIIVVLVHFISKNINCHIRKILDFSQKIKTESGCLEDLDKMKAGDDEMGELVNAYKNFVKVLFTRHEINVANSSRSTDERYPFNELYLKKPPWFEKIKDLDIN